MTAATKAVPPPGWGRFQRRQTLASLGLLLSPVMTVLQGCSTALPQRGASRDWTQGRMLLRVDATAAQGAQSFTAAFELQGDGTTGELRLLSPLGTRLATATWSPSRAHLVLPAVEQSFNNLDELARQALGQAVPLAALPDWLAGRPWGGASHEPQPQGFVQLGWQVNTSARAEGLVEARRAEAPAVLLRVRLELPA